MNNFLKKSFDFFKIWEYIIAMKENTNPLTAAGAPMPCATSPLWNEWAANNPTPEARALGGFDFVKPMLQNLTAIARGARSVEKK